MRQLIARKPLKGPIRPGYNTRMLYRPQFIKCKRHVLPRIMKDNAIEKYDYIITINVKYVRLMV